MARVIPGNNHLQFDETDSWVPVFEVEVTAVTTLYLTPNRVAIYVDGQTYIPFPIALEELTESSDGAIPSTRLICSNIAGDLSDTIKANGSLDGYHITFKIAAVPDKWEASKAYIAGDHIFVTVEWFVGDIRYQESHYYECTVPGTTASSEPTWDVVAGSTTTDGTVTWTEDIAGLDHIIFEEVQEITKTGPINSKTITLEIGAFNPYLVKLLQEKYLLDFCWNTYKGKGCYIKKPDGTYLQPTGFTDHGSCNKSLTECLLNTNTVRFNAFATLLSKGSRFV